MRMYRRNAAKLNYLSLDNPMIAFASKRGFKVNEFTQTRRGDKTEKNTEILAEATHNNVSIRVAGSSRRVDRVYR